MASMKDWSVALCFSACPSGLKPLDAKRDAIGIGSWLRIPGFRGFNLVTEVVTLMRGYAIIRKQTLQMFQLRLTPKGEHGKSDGGLTGAVLTMR